MATVDAAGKVTALNAGTAVITATATADETREATCTITVTHATLEKVNAKAKKFIKVSSGGKVTVKKGLAKGTYKIKVKITAAATRNYKAKTLKKTVKIIVK